MTQANGFQTFTVNDASGKLGWAPADVRTLADHLKLNADRLSSNDIERMIEIKKEFKTVSSYVKSNSNGNGNGNGQVQSIPSNQTPPGGENGFDAKTANTLALQEDVNTLARIRQDAGNKAIIFADTEAQTFANTYANRKVQNAKKIAQALDHLSAGCNQVINQMASVDPTDAEDSDFFLQFGSLNQESIQIPGVTNQNQLPGANQ